MSGISEERLAEVDSALRGGSMEEVGIVLKNAPDMLAEIRRLLAENAELRASYERVEKYAAALSRQREKQAAMWWECECGELEKRPRHVHAAVCSKCRKQMLPA